MQAIIRLLFTTVLLATAGLFFEVVPASAEEDSSSIVLPAPYQGRWIEVDLTTLTATAWEGNTPVYQAPVSTGRRGFETPTGNFRILRRVANETMDSSTYGLSRFAPGGYRVTNVRYTQYITNDGVALHANYWSRVAAFGHWNDSHGCIGMLTADAAWLWDFATVGTPVVVHFSDKAVVPAVAGLAAAEAADQLTAAGFQVHTTDGRSDQVQPGQVDSQTPEGGLLLDRGSVVTLVVSTGPLVMPVRPPEGNQAWVPETVGLSEEEARQRIDEAGLSTAYTNYQTESDIPEALLSFFQSVQPGHVLSSDPVAGTQLPRGTVIHIAVRKP